MELKINEFYWDDNDLVVLTTTDEKYIFKNAYPTSISFPELDFNATEECQIQMDI